MTIATRVLEELRGSSRPLDDDDLARRLGVSHRQAVNQACRKLELEGRLRRYRGSGGKIVNEAVAGLPGRPPGMGTARRSRTCLACACGQRACRIRRLFQGSPSLPRC